MGFQIMPTTLLGAIFRPSYGPDKTMQAETMHLVFTVCNLNNFKTIEVWVDKQLLEFLEYHKSTVQLPNQFCKIISSTQFKGHRWNCKVNQEFSLSISGSFFSGLDPNIYLGFKPEIHFLYQFRGFLSNCWLLTLWFSTRLSCQTRSFELFLSYLLLEVWVSKPRFSIYRC